MKISEPEQKAHSQILAEGRIPARYWGLQASTYIGLKIASENGLNFLKSYSKHLVKCLPGYRRGISYPASDFKTSVYLHGPPRSGKTFLLSYLAKNLVLNGFGDKFKYYTLDEVKEVHFSPSAQFEFRRLFLEPAVLLLDNVSAPKHEGHRAALSRLMRLRSDEGLPVVMACDINYTAFCKLYSLPRTLDSPGSTPTLIEDKEINSLFISDYVAVVLKVNLDDRKFFEDTETEKFGRAIANDVS